LEEIIYSQSECHAEYQVVSVSRKLLSRTPLKTSPQNQCNQSEALFIRTFYIEAGSQAAIVCRARLYTYSRNYSLIWGCPKLSLERFCRLTVYDYVQDTKNTVAIWNVQASFASLDVVYLPS
jgi:hypothetical protein